MNYSIDTFLGKTILNDEFLFFWGHQNFKRDIITKSCLSQWYESPFDFEGITFPTAEHWMMAEKAKLFNDDETLKKILVCTHPSEVKKQGRLIKNFDSKTWDSKKFKIVVQGNLLKFGKSPELLKFLVNTKNKILVEASPDDKIWGIGLAESNPNITKIEKWEGLNFLGFALMEVRDILK